MELIYSTRAWQHAQNGFPGWEITWKCHFHQKYQDRHAVFVVKTKLNFDFTMIVTSIFYSFLICDCDNQWQQLNVIHKCYKQLYSYVHNGNQPMATCIYVLLVFKQFLKQADFWSIRLSSKRFFRAALSSKMWRLSCLSSVGIPGLC